VYKVRFYFNPNGKSPVKEFIDASSESLRAKIIRQLKYLGEYGLTFSNPGLKKLTGTPLWELRILGKDNVRIICVAVINREIVVLHIFRKKSERTSPRDLNLALKRYWVLTTDI